MIIKDNVLIMSIEVRKRPQTLAAKASFTYRKYQLLCIYLILAHFVVIYLCIWSNARHVRKLRKAQSLASYNMHNIQAHTQPIDLQFPDLKLPPAIESHLSQTAVETNAPHTISLSSENINCPSLRAIIVLANYSNIDRRLYYSEYHQVIFKFLYTLTRDWKSHSQTKNNIVKFVILTPEIDMWPEACVDFDQVIAHSHLHAYNTIYADSSSKMCGVSSFTNFQALTKSSQTMLELMQQQFISKESCVQWKEAILLVLNDYDTIQFHSLSLTNINTAPNSHATCLFKSSSTRFPKCLMSVWKI